MPKLMSAYNPLHPFGQVGVNENPTVSFDNPIHSFQFLEFINEHYLNAKILGYLKRIPCVTALYELGAFVCYVF